MILEIGKKYLLEFNVEGHRLIFTGVILALQSNLVNFRDKFDKIMTFNLNNLISAEELKEESEMVSPIFKPQTRGGFK